jgi:DNA replication licensing factor MCM4
VDQADSSSLAGSDPQAILEQFSTERIREFKAFAADGDVYNRLVQAFAPSIWEMDDVKRGILCLLFGGSLPEAQVICS